MKTKMLVIDDEQLLHGEIKYSMESDLYTIDEARNCEESIRKIKANNYDIIIQSQFSRNRESLHLCKKIREYTTTPIIMILLKGEDINKIMALEFGADDCLTRPFNVLELKARVMAILRRIKLCEDRICSEFEIGSFKINTMNRRITSRGEVVNLTGKEFDLFLYLATNPNSVFSREQLLNRIWGYEYFGDLRTVDVHIRRLREKIEKDASKPKVIMTKWGKGYYYYE